ncbi:MAG: hypothetical protein JWQ48_2410 [Conexibacter sp.]|nr:hypothetical protein [Conexibacter sp.]
MSATDRNATETAALAEAIRSEEAIRDEAIALRGDATILTPGLFLALEPLLRRPIPAGFITRVGVVTGKPYASTGVRSAQVLVDRMNNVLTPLWWWDEVEWFDDGRVAEVTVCVGMLGGQVLVRRSSRGGVDRGSTRGNVFKGSETNAAKRAFAAVGPGHEVYLGAADLDPDTNEEAAKAQEQTAGSAGDALLNDAQRQKVLAAFAEEGISDEDIELFLRAAGLDSVNGMHLSHAVKLRELLDDHKRTAVPA